MQIRVETVRDELSTDARQRVVVRRRDGIKLVIVTPGAVDRKPDTGLSNRANHVLELFFTCPQADL